MQPIVKPIILCDEVVVDPQSGKVSVLNIFNAVRIPAAHSLPYQLGKLSVFCIFRGGRGPSRFQVIIRSADTGEILFLTAERIVEFNHPRKTEYILFRLTNVNFPVIGEYFVEIFCNQTFVDDQVLMVLGSGETA